jgi:hypothetical protein
MADADPVSHLILEIHVFHNQYTQNDFQIQNKKDFRVSGGVFLADFKKPG